jgi:protein phosphatase
MSTNSPEPKSPKPGGLLARLRGMVQQAAKPAEAPGEDDAVPTFDLPPAAPPPAPAAEPAAAVPPAAEPAPAEPAAPARLCPICTAPRNGLQAWCDSCGYMFPPDAAPRPAAAAPAAVVTAEAVPEEPAGRLQGRYEITVLLSEREGIARFRGLDHGGGDPVPVTILRMEIPAAALPVEEPDNGGAPPTMTGDEEILPSFDEVLPAAGPITQPLPDRPTWPSVAWERNLLDVVQDPALPGVLDNFTEGGHEYLVEELPAGRLLWDAWDDLETTSAQRFGWLKQIAETLSRLHQGPAILEGLRPDIVVITPDGQARLTDLADLLPLPVPPNAAIRATHYTAPELLAGSGTADARSDLYSFGAMLYALHVGRELTERDFERPGTPKSFVPLFGPDVHPLFGRLMIKTFTREVAHRFPTDEAAKEDATGFTELARVLEVCGRTMDDVRLEVASWTTTGFIRTGNEDAFALIHNTESRMDDLGESVLIILCDGMGGYDAGEVAAAMAIQALRKNLLGQKMFRPLTGGSVFPPAVPPHQVKKDQPAVAPEDAPVPFDVEACKKVFKEALKDANRQVYQASRLPGGGRRTMGCTAEVVFVNGRHVVVGHVGDSRAYHLHEGRLVQLTRDQTLVNRLVELGTLTAEEAEHHPRKNELQQAIGGQPEVEPGIYSGEMRAGDWVLVCSDGVTNHVSNDELQQMLQTEATSAEMAARRLVNFVLINGATDNATIVVVRGT